MSWSHGVKVLTVLTVLASINSESTEDQNYPYNNFYEAPTTFNFHEIFNNKLDMSPNTYDSISNRFAIAAAADEAFPTKITRAAADEPFSSKGVTTEAEAQTTTPENISLHVKSHLVEFDSLAAADPVSTTIPPPMFLLNSSYITTTTPKTPMTTTTEDPDQTATVKIEVKKPYQRGVLDLLFPPKRVKTFKSMFDSLRHILSHTFRR